jgi:hypothetical protein
VSGHVGSRGFATSVASLSVHPLADGAGRHLIQSKRCVCLLRRIRCFGSSRSALAACIACGYRAADLDHGRRHLIVSTGQLVKPEQR